MGARSLGLSPFFADVRPRLYQCARGLRQSFISSPKALSMCSRITPKLHIRGTSWAISPAPCPDLRRSDVLLLALETCFQIESSLALQQARSFEARVLRPTQSWTPAREQSRVASTSCIVSPRFPLLITFA